MIQVRYFARFREELGSEGEQIDTLQVDTVESLLERLRARGGSWGRLFAQDQRVMMAVNQELADRATPLKDGDEVALFPPVTGG
ncbi:MAG: molybdopterin converting factor subunit 1 [Candidatus Thiodiazotropha sp.]|jgi:sulfur-carrier protein